jgi:hypothetical protein
MSITSSGIERSVVSLKYTDVSEERTGAVTRPLEGLRKAMKTCQYSMIPGRDFNSGPP